MSGPGARWRVVYGVVAVATAVIWVGRIRNVVDDGDLGWVGTGWRLALAGSFLVAAGLLGAAVVGRLPARPVGLGVAGWTAGVWLVRGVGILLDPAHDASFKAVHAALMVGSWVLAAALAVAARGAPATGVRAPVTDRHR